MSLLEDMLPELRDLFRALLTEPRDRIHFKRVCHQTWEEDAAYPPPFPRVIQALVDRGHDRDDEAGSVYYYAYLCQWLGISSDWRAWLDTWTVARDKYCDPTIDGMCVPVSTRAIAAELFRPIWNPNGTSRFIYISLYSPCPMRSTSRHRVYIRCEMHHKATSCPWTMETQCSGRCCYDLEIISIEGDMPLSHALARFRRRLFIHTCTPLEEKINTSL
jgi:hypothetical protein